MQRLGKRPPQPPTVTNKTLQVTKAAARIEARLLQQNPSRNQWGAGRQYRNEKSSTSAGLAARGHFSLSEALEFIPAFAEFDAE
jgi:hypothetical protein